jgi:hypothetical protein
MTRRQPASGLRVLAVTALLSLAPSAHAYLDPGTGSLILSAIVGLLATIGLAIKTWWYKIKGLFRRAAPRSGDDGTAGR